MSKSLKDDIQPKVQCATRSRATKSSGPLDDELETQTQNSKPTISIAKIEEKNEKFPQQTPAKIETCSRRRNRWPTGLSRVFQNVWTQPLRTISVNPFVNHWEYSLAEKFRVYTIGIVLMLIRIVPMFLLGIGACLLAKIFSIIITILNRFRIPSEVFRILARDICFVILRASLFFAGFYWIRVDDRRPYRERTRMAPIIPVAPHSSFFDILVILKLKRPTFVSRADNQHIPLIGNVLRLCNGIYVDRADRNSRSKTIAEIRNRANNGEQVLIFPEGTCVNRSALLQMKLGAFIPGLPVQPVLLRWESGAGESKDAVTWSWEGPGPARLLLHSLTRISINLEITILPEYTPNVDERAQPKLFAENIARIFCNELGILQSYYSFDDVPLMPLAKTIALFRSPLCILLLKIAYKLTRYAAEQKQKLSKESVAKNKQMKSAVNNGFVSGGRNCENLDSKSDGTLINSGPDSNAKSTVAERAESLTRSSSVGSGDQSKNGGNNATDSETQLVPLATRANSYLSIGEDCEHHPPAASGPTSPNAEHYTPRNYVASSEHLLSSSSLPYRKSTGSTVSISAENLIKYRQNRSASSDRYARIDSAANNRQTTIEYQYLPLSGTRRRLFRGFAQSGRVTKSPMIERKRDQQVYATFCRFVQHAIRHLEANFELRPIASVDDLISLLDLRRFIAADAIEALHLRSTLIEMLHMLEYSLPGPLCTVHLLAILHLADVREQDMWNRVEIVVRLFDMVREVSKCTFSPNPQSQPQAAQQKQQQQQTWQRRRPAPPKSVPKKNLSGLGLSLPWINLIELRTLLWYALGVQEFNDEFILDRQFDIESLRDVFVRTFRRATTENGSQLFDS